MPSRIDEAGHTKAFDYPVAEHWGESQRTKRSLVGFEPTSAHTYESEIQRPPPVRKVKRDQDDIKKEKLADALYNNDNRELWAEIRRSLVYWGLTPQQQPGSYQGGEMMMKSVFWWRKPEYPEETTDLRQVTDETFHTYGLCPFQGLNLGRSGVKQSELRRDESGALAHRATAVHERG